MSGPWGKRPDGSVKGSGFFGGLKTPTGQAMSELSIRDTPTGPDVPTLVPTLSEDELRSLLNIKDGIRIPDSIAKKAFDHAEMRKGQGRSAFAQPGEQQFGVYPDIQRIPNFMDVPLASSKRSVDPEALRRALMFHLQGQTS